MKNKSDISRKRERVGNQRNAIIPVRCVYPIAQKKSLTRDLREERRDVFETAVVEGLLKDKKNPISVAKTFAELRYSNYHSYFTDFACGLYTAHTGGERFGKVRTLVDSVSLKPERTIFTMSKETVFKLFFGPLVNSSGHAITGAGPVIKEAKKYIERVLSGAIAEPIVTASVQRTMREKKTGDEREIKTVVFGKPIRIHTWTGELLQVELDHHFFPIFNDCKPPKASDLFVTQVAGLTSFLAFGRYLLRSRKGGWYPDTTTARRLILACQAAYEMRSFAPGMVKDSNRGKIAIGLRRQAIEELYPRCVEPTGRVSYKEFAEFCYKVGEMYLAALDETGIADQLSKNTLIPCGERQEEGPGNQSDIVYIVTEQIK